MKCWDFILGGVYSTTISKCQDQIKFHLGPQACNFKDSMKSINNQIMPINKEPFANLDIMCATMIYMKKGLLLESDPGMCLGTLWNYEMDNPDDPTKLIIESI